MSNYKYNSLIPQKYKTYIKASEVNISVKKIARKMKNSDLL